MRHDSAPDRPERPLDPGVSAGQEHVTDHRPAATDGPGRTLRERSEIERTRGRRPREIPGDWTCPGQLDMFPGLDDEHAGAS